MKPSRKARSLSWVFLGERRDLSMLRAHPGARNASSTGIFSVPLAHLKWSPSGKRGPAYRAANCHNPSSQSWKPQQNKRANASVIVFTTSQILAVQVSVDRRAGERPTAKRASAAATRASASMPGLQQATAQRLCNVAWRTPKDGGRGRGRRSGRGSLSGRRNHAWRAMLTGWPRCA